MTNEIYRRYAFINYSHRDVKIAKWLHKELEAYKLPAEIKMNLKIPNIFDLYFVILMIWIRGF